MIKKKTTLLLFYIEALKDIYTEWCKEGPPSTSNSILDVG